MNELAQPPVAETKITTTAWQELPASSDRPVLVIADVHGHAPLLEALHGLARDIIDAGDLEGGAIIRLGDLIDRGPASIRCLDLAREGLGRPAIEEVNLLGNHEQLLLIALCHEDPQMADEKHVHWILRCGGHSVVEELGLERFATPQEIVTALGPDRMTFLQRLRTAHTSGGITFVHAGLNPHVDPSVFLAQTWREYPRFDFDSPFWIREEFLNFEGVLPSGRFVVHGHTPEPHGPVLKPHRLGLDLHSFKSGRVAMAEIQGSHFRTHIASYRPAT